MAKDMANRKVISLCGIISGKANSICSSCWYLTGCICFQVDEMKAIEKVKARRERRRLEPEVRLRKLFQTL